MELQHDHRRPRTQTLIDHVEELTALDAAIGDGDHGLNMKRGALAIQAKLPELAGQVAERRAEDDGHDLHVHHRRLVGPGVRHADGHAGQGAAGRSRHAADMARALAAGIAALSRLGKVEVGQKTLLDVLDPVQKVLAARRRRPGRARPPMRLRQRAGHRADGRDQGPRVVPRRARARPRRPGLALDGIDHRRGRATALLNPTANRFRQEAP